MRRSAVCMTLLMPMLMLVAGCDGHTSLSGQIVGPDDEPVVGAKVRLVEADQPGRGRDSTTGETGGFSVALTPAPFDIPLVVTVTKDGYKPYRKEFKAAKWADFPSKIVLEPDPQAAAQPKE